MLRGGVARFELRVPACRCSHAHITITLDEVDGACRFPMAHLFQFLPSEVATRTYWSQFTDQSGRLDVFFC